MICMQGADAELLTKLRYSRCSGFRSDSRTTSVRPLMMRVMERADFMVSCWPGIRSWRGWRSPATCLARTNLDSRFFAGGDIDSGADDVRNCFRGERRNGPRVRSRLRSAGRLRSGAVVASFTQLRRRQLGTAMILRNAVLFFRAMCHIKAFPNGLAA